MYKLPALTTTQEIRRIAVLTSGGDSPGMNPAIRAVVRTSLKYNIEVVGIHHGYAGLLSEDFEPLDTQKVSGLSHRGGTYLRSARCLDFLEADVRAKAAGILRNHEVDALVVIGGDGSLTGAHLLEQEQGTPVLGLPGTIDNDIYGTDDSIGFDTAVTTAVEAVDKICDTATSHDRHFLVEVMGRNSGFLGVQVGIAAGAEMILIPEIFSGINDISQQLTENRRSGIGSSGIIVVSEGPTPGIAYRIAEQMRALGEDPRVCILGHIQRGGAPTAHDRVLASTLGNMAVHYLRAGYSDILVGIDTGKVVDVPLKQVISRRKGLDMTLMDLIDELQR